MWMTLYMMLKSIELKPRLNWKRGSYETEAELETRLIIINIWSIFLLFSWFYCFYIVEIINEIMYNISLEKLYWTIQSILSCQKSLLLSLWITDFEWITIKKQLGHFKILQVHESIVTFDYTNGVLKDDENM